MNILYGVVGEGMGHATRSRVVIEHLLSQGHRVMVVASSRAFGFLRDSFEGRPGFQILEIHGLCLAYRGNDLSIRESLTRNIDMAPAGVQRNVQAYRQLRERFQAQLVISDFDSWSYFYAKRHRLPVISIDNMQVINRCSHDTRVVGSKRRFYLTRAAIKVKLPRAQHYFMTSFFQAPVRKGRSSLVPPILRPEILAAKREPGSHILVYQTQAKNPQLLKQLMALPYDFKIYGLNRDERRDRLHFRPFSQTGFVDDLRTARAVIAGGGFSLMSEAVHLGVPMLSIPIRKQYEQELNARYLEKLGYGQCFQGQLTGAVVQDFLERVPEYQAQLARYPRQGNGRLFQELDRSLEALAA